MRVHSNASTNKKQRLAIRQSAATCRELARELRVSPATVCAWKRRDSPEDRSSRPKDPPRAFGPEEETLILGLRRRGLALDDLLDAVRVPLPDAKRATVHRVLARHGVSGRGQGQAGSEEALEGNGPDGKAGTFKEYGPGFVHMDCFRLPALGGVKRYCFVAIDRATRLSHLAAYEQKDAASAVAFFKECLAFFPFRVKKLLTDNGREFTLKGFRNRWGSRVNTRHALDALCEALGIEHRTTRPYTPKTNGMVERMNGLTKEATVKAHRYGDAREMIADLGGWLVRYNFCRKHRRLAGRTPYEEALRWHAKDPSLFIRDPTGLLAYRTACSQPCET